MGSRTVAPKPWTSPAVRSDGSVRPAVDGSRTPYGDVPDRGPDGAGADPGSKRRGARGRLGRRPIVLVTITNTSLADLDRNVLPDVTRLMASTGGALTPRLPAGPEDQLSAFASLGAAPWP